MPTILRSDQPTAKKAHKCNYCGGAIPVGEKYENTAMIFDGDFYTWKCHLRCQNIASKLKMFDECDEGVTGDDFHECIVNEFNKLVSGEYDPKITFQEQLDFVCKHYLI